MVISLLIRCVVFVFGVNMYAYTPEGIVGIHNGTKDSLSSSVKSGGWEDDDWSNWGKCDEKPESFRRKWKATRCVYTQICVHKYMHIHTYIHAYKHISYCSTPLPNATVCTAVISKMRCFATMFAFSSHQILLMFGETISIFVLTQR